GVPVGLGVPAVPVNPVVVRPAGGRLLVHPVAAAPTKWGIVTFPLEQVHAAMPSAVGEAVVAAGITLEQAAAGVARAWVAEGTAVAAEAMAAAEAVVVVVAAAAVVVAAAAVVEVVAAVAGDRRNKIMISKLNMMKPAKTVQI